MFCGKNRGGSTVWTQDRRQLLLGVVPPTPNRWPHLLTIKVVSTPLAEDVFILFSTKIIALFIEN